MRAEGDLAPVRRVLYVLIAVGFAGPVVAFFWEQIPQPMRDAQMAAEDETFMSNSGFDLKAILRTAWNRLSGGTGGGSTIGQEYVKNATGNNENRLSRKFLEMVESDKTTTTYSKQDILTAYLSTVYFGRGAYGIQAAAHTYYGEDVSKLLVGNPHPDVDGPGSSRRRLTATLVHFENVFYF